MREAWMPFLHNYIFGRAKIVMFSPRMSKRYIANAHGNVLDACCQGEVLVTYPPTGILGKVTGGCWNTFEKYSFISGLGMVCFFIAEKTLCLESLSSSFCTKNKSYTSRFYVNFFGWRLFVCVMVQQEWSYHDETASIFDCLIGWYSPGNIKHWGWRNWKWFTAHTNDVSKTKNPIKQ